MTSVLFGLSVALTSPSSPRAACAPNLAWPTSTTAKRAPTLNDHLARLGYDANAFRFAVIALGPNRRAHPGEIVERFTEAMKLGHYPIVIDQGDLHAEVRHWRAGLLVPRDYVAWLGLIARALEHRQQTTIDAEESREFQTARFALYRQFEVVSEVVATMDESTEFDDPEAFVAATEVAWPTLSRFVTERPLALAALPPAELRRLLKSRVLTHDDAPPLASSARRALLDFHHRVREHRDSLRRIPR